MRAFSAAASSLNTSGKRKANSSAPMRVTVEWPSIAARSRMATWTRMSSPALLAEQIVDRLEAVEVE